MADRPTFVITVGEKLVKKTPRQIEADNAFLAWQTGKFKSKRAAIKSIGDFDNDAIRYLYELLNKRIDS